VEEDILNLPEQYHNPRAAHVAPFDYPGIARHVGHVSAYLTLEWDDLGNGVYTKPRWDLRRRLDQIYDWDVIVNLDDLVMACDLIGNVNFDPLLVKGREDGRCQASERFHMRGCTDSRLRISTETCNYVLRRNIHMMQMYRPVIKWNCGMTG